MESLPDKIGAGSSLLSQPNSNHRESVSMSNLRRGGPTPVSRTTTPRISDRISAVNELGIAGVKESLHSYESATARLNKEHVYIGHEPSFGFLTDIKKEIHHEQEPADAFLVYSKQEEVHTTIFEKFKSEDGHYLIEKVIQNSVVLLNVRETNVQKIVNYALSHMLEDEPESLFTEAVTELFFPSTVSTLSRVIQGLQYTEVGGFDRNQSWICTFAHLNGLRDIRTAFVHLHQASNLGGTSQEAQFILIVLGPNTSDSLSGLTTKKSNFEVAQSLSSVFTRIGIREDLLHCKTEEQYKEALINGVKEMSESQSEHVATLEEEEEKLRTKDKWWPIGYYMWRDLCRRVPKYTSDFKDGFQDLKSVGKILSTTLFLYFACLLPSIAFGVLNASNTGMTISVIDVMLAQTVGGIVFSLIGGQPMLILLTTAPIAIYIKTIYNITYAVGDQNLFLPMFAWTGIWNSFFLMAYALLGLSRFMRYSTRSSEEIFAIFISIAFIYDGLKHVVNDFQVNYSCDVQGNVSHSNVTSNNDTALPELGDGCNMEVSLLYLMLCLGTVWLAVYLYNFKQTPFLSAGKRELVSDYALPGACLLLSFFGSYCFRRVPLKVWNYDNNRSGYLVPFWELPPELIVACMGLGFSLSLLFFMDQNIASAIVNSPSNKLVKGPAENWDLFVVAVINLVFSLLGLPWVHGALPHSPFHVKALADVQERVDLSHVTQIIVKVREIRTPSLLAHICIGCSIFLLPYPLQWIPSPVLDGLFIALAITSLVGNQFFERVCLLFVERAAYPPNHYIRICPKKMLYLFTLLQVAQLAVVCVFGFSPISYMKMAFPIFIMLLIPFRMKIVPMIIPQKYLDCLDHNI